MRTTSTSIIVVTTPKERHIAVRETTLLRKIIGIKNLIVTGLKTEDGLVVLGVRPSWQRARCSRCHKARSCYDKLAERRWRHLDLAGVGLEFSYAPRRVSCPKCGVVVEWTPWSADVESRFTQDFENQVAYMAQRCDKTSIRVSMCISWATVGRIIERVVRRLRPSEPLADLKYIGVDELSYRKHHHYLTLVTNLVENKIVWGAAGKDAETLIKFFEELGQEGCAKIEAATMDMAKPFIKAVREKLPQAQIIFDRFHVQQLVSKALDETRREEWRRLEVTGDKESARYLKHTRWALLKNPWNLRESEKGRLSTVQSTNSRLYRAYLLKETFAGILDRKQRNVVDKLMREWLSWAGRSRLPAFKKAAATIREHLADILAYVTWQLSNGVVEGLNNKARLITRRAYGFHSADAILAMIMLCCAGLDLQPVIKWI